MDTSIRRCSPLRRSESRPSTNLRILAGVPSVPLVATLIRRRRHRLLERIAADGETTPPRDADEMPSAAVGEDAAECLAAETDSTTSATTLNRVQIRRRPDARCRRSSE